MKRIFTLVVSLLMVAAAHAQLNQVYTYTATAGTYTEITGGSRIRYGDTVLLNNTVGGATSNSAILDDEVVRRRNIGFTFNFNGSNYTQFGFGMNGWLYLGGDSTVTNTTSPISSATPTNVIAALTRDIVGTFATAATTTAGSTDITLNAPPANPPFAVGDTVTSPVAARITAINGNVITLSAAPTTSSATANFVVRCGQVRWQTIGTAPNRTLVLQYKNFARYSATPIQNEIFNFQIRLGENGQIDIVYGDFLVATTSTTVQVGIKGTSTNAGGYINLSSTTDWSNPPTGSTNSATMTLSATVLPASGTTYNFAPPAPCTGTPQGGSAAASSNQVCRGESFLITNTGYTTLLQSGNLVYQWQQSTNNGTNWTDITNATNPDSVRLVQSATSIQYRLRVLCNGNGNAGNSTPTTVAIAPANVSYTSLSGGSYVQDFESWSTDCFANEQPESNWRNQWSLGDSSWRRNDQGASANWTGLTSGAYTPAFRSGAYSARFHSYQVASGRTGSLDAHFNLSGAVTSHRVGFYYINPDGTTDSLTVLLSTDGGATFNQLGNALKTAAGWALNTFDFTTNSATTIIRLRANGSAFSGDIGVDSFYVTRLNNCTGTPAAGTTTTAITQACGGTTVRIYNTGFQSNVGISGLTYQWQQSTNGGTTYSNITGATVPDSVITFHPGVTTLYRLQVVCATGPTTSNSNAVTIAGIPVAARATIPASFGFETAWTSTCGTRDIPAAAWRNQWTVGDSSWRRDDDGAAAGWVNATLWSYSPAGANGTARSARFHSAEVTPAGRSGALNLLLDASTGVATKQLTYWYINTSGSSSNPVDRMEVFLSTDSGLTFTRIDSVGIVTSWTQRVIPFTSSSLNTVIRFRAVGDYGTTDIGLDEVSIITINPCSGTPTSGPVTGSTNASCPNTRILLTNTAAAGNVGTTGLSYQWQQSLNGGAFTNIAGSVNGDTANVIFTGVPTQYRLVTTCANSSVSNNSAPFAVAVNNVLPATLPAAFNFEAVWQNGCGLRDVPTNAWRNQWVTTDSSWRQDNDSSSANWSNVTSSPYNPRGANGTLRSARFRTSQVASPRSGSLNLFVDASTGNATRRLSYYAINGGGADRLETFLSTDNGATFVRIDSVGVLTTWTQRTVDFNSSSANTILRFRATGDNGFSDYGLDEVVVSTVNAADAAIVSSASTGNILSTGAVPMRSVIRNSGSVATASIITSVKVIQGTTYRSVVTRQAGLAANANDTLQHAPFTGWTSGTTYTVRDTVYLNADVNLFNDTLSTTVTPEAVRPTLVYWSHAASRDSVVAQLNSSGSAGNFNVVSTIPSLGFRPWTNVWVLTSGSSAISATLRDSLRAFLDNSLPTARKRLLIFGNDIGWSYDPSRNTAAAPADTVFYRQYLRARYRADNWTSSSLIPTGSARKFYGVGAYSNMPVDSVGTVDGSPDLISATNGGSAAFVPNSVTANGDTACIAISFVGPNYSTFYGSNLYSAYIRRNAYNVINQVIINNVATPVRLSSFTGERAGAANKLFFTTATEQANRGFVVERSADGRNYSKIGFVATQATDGNSNQPLSYLFSDDKPLTGLNYYRLRQQDRSGREELSQVVVLRTDDVKQLQLTMLYPNPARTQVGLMVEAPKAQSVQVIITDLQGRQVASRRMEVVQGNNQLAFNIAGLAQGSYLLKLVCNDGCATPAKQFVKQ